MVYLKYIVYRLYSIPKVMGMSILMLIVVVCSFCEYYYCAYTYANVSIQCTTYSVYVVHCTITYDTRT